MPVGRQVQTKTPLAGSFWSLGQRDVDGLRTLVRVFDLEGDLLADLERVETDGLVLEGSGVEEDVLRTVFRGDEAEALARQRLDGTHHSVVWKPANNYRKSRPSRKFYDFPRAVFAGDTIPEHLVFVKMLTVAISTL